MTQFCFTLIGTNLPLVMDVEASDLSAVADTLCTDRFIRGDVVSDAGVLTRALIPVCRIQFVAEVVE